MSGVDARLADVLDPVRDMAVGEILEAMAAELQRGSDVLAEPKMRDAAGRAIRDGALQLPRRGDLAVSRDGRTLIRRIEGGRPLSFAPVRVMSVSGFATRVGPFAWDAAEILLMRGQDSPSWAPLRYWYLEWFQSRFSEVAPDLDGAVHALDGPVDVPEGWRITVDFGSAPVSTISDLIEALERTGCAGVTIGSRMDA